MNKILINILFICLTAISAPALSKEIKLGATKQTLESSYGVYSKTLLTKVFKNLGFDLKVVELPPYRLAKQVKSKAVDGELIRMSNYAIEKPFLSRVNPPLFKFSVAAYSLDGIKIKDWKDMEGKVVGHRKGLKVIENELLKIFTRGEIIHVSTLAQAKTFIGLKRIDYYIEVEKVFDDFLLKDPSMTIKKSGILKKDTAHVFLLNSFNHLIPKIQTQLKKELLKR